MNLLVVKSPFKNAELHHYITAGIVKGTFSCVRWVICVPSTKVQTLIVLRLR